MDIVQRFKDGIAWYQPTTDANSWQSFYDTTYSVDYSSATAETLKSVTWQSQKLQTTVDVGMWGDRAARLQKFLSSDTALSDYDTLEAEAIQYDFVACYLNDYSQAAHNNDLWQSINDSATKVLNENIVPDGAGRREVGGKPNLAAINPLWILPAIGLILFNAFKTVNLSYYRPTEDTDTWAYFQNIVFNMTGIPRVGFVYQHTYLLTNVTSTVDTGIWSLMTSAAGAFLDANLGQMPAGADAQIKLAMSFCDVLFFNYEHAAHNADLFKAYAEAFATAKQKLQLLLRNA